MCSFQLDYVIEEVLKRTPSPEQSLLRRYVGVEFDKTEAASLWPRIVEHKWYVGERLGRDIGLRAAAIDFVENIYGQGAERNSREPSGRFASRLGGSLAGTARNYFIAKSGVVVN